ncbi:MAG: hypothetical protein JNM32_10450 [Dechloromonas sp.]|nr:hypothetical protein [Dechloromonas sp.]
MSYTTGGFTVDEVGFIQLATSKVLAAVARGELDLNQLAREELAFRGQDINGVWVGFDRAAELHLGKKTSAKRETR